MPHTEPLRHPDAHLGAEALGHVPEDVRLHPGQQQLTRGPGRHVPIAQDQCTPHFVGLALAPILRGQSSVTIAPSRSRALQPQVPKNGRADLKEDAT